jgi:hypothetical protein
MMKVFGLIFVSDSHKVMPALIPVLSVLVWLEFVTTFVLLPYVLSWGSCCQKSHIHIHI